MRLNFLRRPGKGLGKSPNEVPDPPFLGRRERPVTAIAAPEWPLRQATAVSNSPLFKALPPNIRRRILEEAFGDQRVHMDLRLQHPIASRAERVSSHGGATAPLRDLSSPSSTRNTSTPRTWQWWSCVCHRGQPGDLYDEPMHTDTCLQGRAQCCDYWAGEGSQKCFIGVMGWLLTCKQAYTEGIDVLYSTNTISMASHVLIDGLLPEPGGPSFLLPQRLRSIKSLEMRWDLRLFNLDLKREDNDRYRYERRLQLLSTYFPNLTRLTLEFTSNVYLKTNVPPKSCLNEIDEILLKPLGEMLYDFDSHFQCSIELPWSIYWEFEERACLKNTRVQNTHTPGARRFWHQHPTPAKEKPDSDDSESERTVQHRHGFWIRIGEESDLRFRCDGKAFWVHNQT